MNIEPINIINGIEFSIFGNENVLAYSVFDRKSNGIYIPELYDNQEPKQNGLIDPRMGSTNDNILCNTCNLSSKYCVGHFGHINLETPVYHIGYFPIVKKILGCVCLKCSSLRTNKTNEEITELIKNKHGKNRFDEIVKLTKETRVCSKPESNCGSPLPKIKQELAKSQAKLDLMAEYEMNSEKSIKQLITPLECYDILQRISSETCTLLGLNSKKTRPEQMIYRVFPVPPVAIRPSVRVEGLSYTRDDDLTKQLSAIIKSNTRVLKSKSSIKPGQNTNFSNLEYSEKILQHTVAEYFDNNSQYVLPSTYKGKNLKSLTARLKTKEGRFRSNLMGKRIDYCGRSVITPDTCININEIGVPITIAQTLTYPEYVTDNNLEQLNIYVKNGRDKYPGANYVIQLRNNEYSKPIDLKYSKNNIELKVGDIVERQLIDGDIVLFNRQPTLHKYSMMGHYVKIINDKKYATFRLNVGVTTPYNADYDGDEMNISVPRTAQTKIELEELTSIEKLLINAQTSLPLMGCKMDTIIGVYILTNYDIVIPKKIVMNMLTYIENPIDKMDNYLLIDKDTYTGKELLSFILPKKININDEDIIIEYGNLIKGSITSSRLSDGKPKSLIRLILELYDDQEARKFFDNIQKIINQFNLWYGFTTSFKDIIYNSDIHEKILNLVKNVVTKVNIYITEMENDPTTNTPEVFEENIFNNLNNVRSTIGSLIINNFTNENSINIIKNSGSSGKVNPDSISKNIAIEAQHATRNGRMEKMDARRTLPYFCRDLDNPFERGFNQHGFLQGLTYPEFVFNNITAREGLINIQIKTAESGYIQHRLTKNMEDFYITYDRTVRNINDSIIQYSYSDSGTNSTKQFIYNMRTIEEDDNKIKIKYTFNKNELKEINYNETLNIKFYNKLIRLRTRMRNLLLQTRTEFNEFSNAGKFMLPININKIKSLMIPEKKSNLTPSYILTELKKFIKNINILLNHNSNSKLLIIKDNKAYKKTLTLAIYEIFAPKRCIFEYFLSKNNFNDIITKLDIDIKKNLVEPGEMIGIIAGQSICENITQTSLRSHHLTGVSSKTAANSGVNRIIEIINNTKDIKTPRMIIKFKNEFKQNDKYAQQIKNHIKQTILSEIRDSIEVYYDPLKQFEKKDNIINNFGKKNNILLKWLIRIEFNKEELLSKNIELLDIISQFYHVLKNKAETIKKITKDFKNLNESIMECDCLSNNDNDDIPIIHIRFNMINYNMNILHNFIDLVIDNVKLKGIKNIEESEMNQIPVVSFDNDIHKLDISKKEYIVTTAGINIEELRTIKGIDQNRTLINDINIIYKLYGIEAARFVILDELMALTNNSVNYNHLSVLVDYMTKDGFILSIDRNGLAKTNSSLLNKISFEKPIDQLINAAMFNEYDEIKGVSGRIMTGRNIRCGTGICDIIFNTEMVVNSEKIIKNNINNYIDNENNELVNDIFNNDYDNIFIPN